MRLNFTPPEIGQASPVVEQQLQQIIENTAGGGGIAADVNITAVSGVTPDLATETTLNNVYSSVGQQGDGKNTDANSDGTVIAFIKGVVSLLVSYLPSIESILNSFFPQLQAINSATSGTASLLLLRLPASLGTQTAANSLAVTLASDGVFATSVGATTDALVQINSNASLIAASKSQLALQGMSIGQIFNLAAGATRMVLFPKNINNVRAVVRGSNTTPVVLTFADISNSSGSTNGLVTVTTASGNVDSFTTKTITDLGPGGTYISGEVTLVNAPRRALFIRNDTAVSVSSITIIAT